MGNTYDFKELSRNLLGSSSSFLSAWLPDGKNEGKEWVATNPTRGDAKKGSFKVCKNTGKWCDFATGDKGGDLISLYQYLRGVDAKTAYLELGGEVVKKIDYTKNPDSVKVKVFEETVVGIFPPASAPAMPNPRGRKAEALYSDMETGEELYPATVYKDGCGKPIYRVVTSRNKSGNKYPIPLSWCRWVRQKEVWSDSEKRYVKTEEIVDTTGWNQKDWKNERPLCGLNYLITRPESTVFIVEGEKTWASLVSSFPEYAVITWRGGTPAVLKSNWAEIRDRNVIICPDYDEVGQKASLKIGEILSRQGNNVKICWENLSDNLHKKGWDLADIENPLDVKKYIKNTAIFLTSVNERININAEIGVEDKRDLLPKKNNATQVCSSMLDAQKQLRCLGYAGDNKCYFICRTRGVVVALSPDQMGNLNNLMSLMPLSFWYDLFPNKKGGGIDKYECSDALQRWADQKGYFNTDVIRGVGVWKEMDGSYLFHLGQELLVNKKIYNINEYESRYMYEATNDVGISLVKPLVNADSKILLDICNWLDWDCPIYGTLLAGFIVVAPLCGGLEWRPHIWITGVAGSGKTTVVSKILQKACGEMNLFVQGETSSAGIRQQLGSDALPVIFDEFEGDSPKRLEELQKTIDLARQASSESCAKVLKGSGVGEAIQFKIRSCFAFSSINVNIKHYADASRITVLTLKDPKVNLLEEEEKKTRINEFTEYENLIKDTITKPYVNALQIRSFELLEIIRKNARIFGAEVQKHLGSARIGDQLGILCAGAYSLEHQGIIACDEAKDWIRKQDWTLSTPDDDAKDHDDCLSKMMQFILRSQKDKHFVENSVGELIANVFSGKEYSDEHDAVLKRYGFKVDRDLSLVHIANSHTKLREIMRDSPYQSWNRLLLRIDGAKAEKAVRFSQGTVSRAVSIPKHIILAGAMERNDAAF